MSFLSQIRNAISAPERKYNSKTFIGPNKETFGVINIPPAITDPENKLIYILWKEGKQPFYYLSILSGIPHTLLKNTLDTLITKNKVEKTKAPSLSGISDNITDFYSLNRNLFTKRY